MKKIFYTITFLLILGIFSSCDDFLSRNPDNRTKIDSPDKIESLLVSAYPEFTHIYMCELMSDNVTDIGPAAPYSYQFATELYRWSTVSSLTQDTPYGLWNQSYLAIAAANTVLEAITEMVESGEYTEAELAHYKGEALVARAYNHFILANMFGEHYNPATAEQNLTVPFVNEVEKVPNVTYTQATIKEIYDAIERDIEEALPLNGNFLIKERGAQNSWHFNRKAAATFASRFYLYRGLDTDWDKVIVYANIALENNPSSVLRDWSVIDNMSWDAFHSNYSRSNINANYLLMSVKSTGGRQELMRYNMDITMSRLKVSTPSVHPTRISIKNDSVYYLSKAMLGYSSIGSQFLYKIKEEFKRDNMNSNSGLAYVMYPVFVAEEALFNMMEAYVMKNEFEKAIETMDYYYAARIENYNYDRFKVTEPRIISAYTGNQYAPDITPHYNNRLSDLQRIYLKCILTIKSSEFLHEGHRWFDIKRMHMEITHKIHNGETLVLTPNDPRRVIAIPDVIISSGLLLSPVASNAEPVQEKPELKPELIDFSNDY